MSDRITAKLLLRASDEFGWLVEYAAFRADLAGDVELLDLLLRRAGVRPSQHVDKEKPWLSQVPHWIGAIGVGVLALNARLIEDIVAAGGPPAWIALAVVAPLGTAALTHLAITSHRAIQDTIRSAPFRRISQLKALLAALLFVAASVDLQKDMELGYLSVGTAVPLLAVMWIAEGETGGCRLEIALRRASAWALRLF